MPRTKTKPKLKHRRRKHKRRLRAGPPVALIAGGLLLVMAGPRFMSALVELPGNYVPQRLERGEKVSDAALAKMVSTRRGSLEWYKGEQQWVELGLAQLRQAKRSQSNRVFLLRGAVADLRKGLAMKPAKSPSCLWLAEAELLLGGGATHAVARAIEMSIRTALLDHRYYMKRLEISLLSWPQMNMDARQRVVGQVRIARRKFSRELAKLADRSDYRVLVRRILGNASKG